MTKIEALQSMLQGNKITHPLFKDKEYYLYYGEDKFRNMNACPIDINNRSGDGYTLWEKPIEYVDFMTAWDHMKMASKARLRLTNRIYYCADSYYSVYDEENNIIININSNFIDGEWELL